MRSYTGAAEIPNGANHGNPIRVNGHSVLPEHDFRQFAIDETCGSGITVAVSQSDFPAGVDFGNDYCRRVPLDRSVSLREIRRDGERRHINLRNFRVHTIRPTAKSPLEFDLPRSSQ